mgnify:CR=1 FL=1
MLTKIPMTVLMYKNVFDDNTKMFMKDQCEQTIKLGTATITTPTIRNNDTEMFMKD